MCCRAQGDGFSSSGRLVAELREMGCLAQEEGLPSSGRWVAELREMGSRAQGDGGRAQGDELPSSGRKIAELREMGRPISSGWVAKLGKINGAKLRWFGDRAQREVSVAKILGSSACSSSSYLISGYLHNVCTVF
jgi:hypothetical protein